MKSQLSFSGKNKKNVMNLSSAESAQRVVKVNICFPKHLTLNTLWAVSADDTLVIFFLFFLENRI